MHVFAFDRDWTVDVNPHPRHQAVPLDWVRHLAHETEHAVYAIGNQDLADEAAIPGVVDIVGRHDDEWDEWLGDKGPSGRYEQFPKRRERLSLITDLHPDADEYIAVDDLDLSDVDDWTHYHAWEFVPAVEQGDVDLDLPWTEEPMTDGGEFRPAGITPSGVDDLTAFLDDHDDAPGFEVRWEKNETTHTRVFADVDLIEQTVRRPSRIPMVACLPPNRDMMRLPAEDIQEIHTTELRTDGRLPGETAATKATWVQRRAAQDPHIVDVSSVVALLEQTEGESQDEALSALKAIAEERPAECTPAIPVLRSLLADETSGVALKALAVFESIAGHDAAEIAPHVDVITPYLTSDDVVTRLVAARCLSTLAEHDPSDVLDAVPALATILVDEAPGQSHAIYALSCVTREFPQEVAPVADTLAWRVVDNSLDDTTRFNATAALGRVVSEDPTVGPDIIDDVAELLDAENTKIRANATALMSDISIKHTIDLKPHVETFVVMLEEDDDYIRVNASGTLSRIAEDFPDELASYEADFIDLLDDEHELVRTNGCWALGRLGDRATDAIPALEALVGDETNEDVLTRAQWAIAQIEV